MTSIFLMFLLAAPAQQAATPRPVELCTIQGVVLKEGTNEPLRKAIVEAQPANPNSQAIVGITDVAGRFELKDLYPGTFRLLVRRNGFVMMQYSQHSLAGESGVTLTLSPGQKITGVTLKLTPAGAITGHAYDEDGDPIMRAEVNVTPYPSLNWQQQLQDSNSAQTDDFGGFRVYGLPPGQYIVRVSIWGDASVHARAKQSYVPAYYPGVSDSAHAAPITLRGSDEFSGVDFTLQPVHTVSVKGHAFIAACGGNSGPASVSLGGQGSDLYGVGRAVTHDENGQTAFEFSGVPPGSYYLRGIVVNEGKGCAGRQPLEVADTDIDGAALVLTPGVDIHGRLRVEGRPDAPVSNISIALFPKGDGTPFGNIRIIFSKADGSFLLQGIFNGDHEITLENLPETWFLKSARLDGVDVLTGVTVDTLQAPGALDLLLSPNGATLEGVVSKDQQVFQGATVALVPDPPRRGVKRLFKSTSTDQNGHFVFQGIAPGDYKVFSWEKFYPSALTRPEFLVPYDNLGQSLHIAEGSHSTMNLTVIPTPRPEPVSSWEAGWVATVSEFLTVGLCRCNRSPPVCSINLNTARHHGFSQKSQAFERRRGSPRLRSEAFGVRVACYRFPTRKLACGNPTTVINSNDSALGRRAEVPASKQAG